MSDENNKYDAVLKALRNGCPVQEVMKVFKISVNTVRAIIDHELGGLEKWTADVINKLTKVAEQATQGLTDERGNAA